MRHVLVLLLLLGGLARADAPAPTRHKKAIHTPGRKGLIIAPGGSSGSGGGLTPIGSPGSCTFCSISFDSFGRVTHGSNGGSPTVTAASTTYAPSIGGDWSPSPGNVADALDQLAADLAALSGTVISVSAGAGLSGGTITTTGTISMPNVGPGAGTLCGSTSYANSVTLDAQGRVTAVACATPSGGGGISGLTTGAVPVATSSSAIGNSKIILDASTTYYDIQSDGTTGGNGGLNIQPTHLVAYGAELSLDNSLEEVGGDTWSIINFNANTSLDKAFAIMNHVNALFVIFPNGHTLVDNAGGDRGHALSVGGDVETIGSGKGIIFGDGTHQTTATSPGYSPAVGTNWSGTPPTTIVDALDRIAAMAAGGTLGAP